MKFFGINKNTAVAGDANGRSAAEIVRPSGKRSQGDGEAQHRQGQDSTSGNVGSGTPKNNKKPAQSADSLANSNQVWESRLGIDPIVSDPKTLSRGKDILLTKEPVEGFAPLESRIPSLDPNSITGSSELYHNDSDKEIKEKVNKSVLQDFCPYCGSVDFVKRGLRQKKSGPTQLYICRGCGRTFTPAWTKGRQHGWSTVLEAVSYYNLGFSLEQVSSIMKQKLAADQKRGSLEARSENADNNSPQPPLNSNNPTPPPLNLRGGAGGVIGGGETANAGEGELKSDFNLSPSTIGAWVEQNREICAYHRMRAFAIKHFSPYEVIDTCTLAHRQLYRFRYHRAKTKYIMEDDFKHYKFYPLKEFLDNVCTETPHQYFTEGERMSEIGRSSAGIARPSGTRSQGDGKKISAGTDAKGEGNIGTGTLKFSKTEMIVRSKANYATKLAALVFRGVSENKARHEALQRFFIANDSVTVATEVPVYIKREDLAHMMTQLGFKLYRSASERPAAEVVLPSGSGPQGDGRTQLRQGRNSTEGNVGSGTAGDSNSTSGNIGSGTDNSPQPPLNSNNPTPPPLNLRGGAGGVIGAGEGALKEMTLDEIPKLITGHIDFLQIRNGSVHILDYKGCAAKERPIEQLTLYALALSRLTGLRLFHFKCAWFDEKDYFEFFPLHVVYKPGRGSRKVYTKEGVYNMNERAEKMETLRPINERKKFKAGKPNF